MIGITKRMRNIMDIITIDIGSIKYGRMYNIFRYYFMLRKR